MSRDESNQEVVSLYVERRGQGPGLVLIHGSATDAGTWAPQLSALNGAFDVVAYDRRGTRRSPRRDDRGSQRVEDHAEDAACLIRALFGDPVLLLGSSFGAVVCIEVAARHPELLRGVIACEPPLVAAAPDREQHRAFCDAFARVLAAEGGERAAELFLRTVLGDAVYDRIPKRRLAASLSLHRAIAEDIAAADAYRPDWNVLRNHAVPTLLVYGERSAPHFRPIIARLAAELPHAEVVEIANAGHLVHIEAAERLHREVRRFAAGISGW
ncbi:MAG: alpha/beta hydrolase [Candidatus Schekmanbacteria bacterium]|nr:alpha/beta hydrolase [Candidatus Schekmanbacteria bacterium]